MGSCLGVVRAFLFWAFLLHNFVIFIDIFSDAQTTQNITGYIFKHRAGNSDDFKIVELAGTETSYELHSLISGKRVFAFLRSLTSNFNHTLDIHVWRANTIWWRHRSKLWGTPGRHERWLQQRHARTDIYRRDVEPRVHRPHHESQVRCRTGK